MISVLGGQAHTHYLIRILFPHHEMKISLCLHSIFFSFALMYRPQKIVWHGSNMKGSKMDEKFCQEWHSQNGNTMGLGSSLMKHMLLDQSEYTCNNAFIVLCIENTARHNLRK